MHAAAPYVAVMQISSCYLPSVVQDMEHLLASARYLVLLYANCLSILSQSWHTWNHGLFFSFSTLDNTVLHFTSYLHDPLGCTTWINMFLFICIWLSRHVIYVIYIHIVDQSKNRWHYRIRYALLHIYPKYMKTSRICGNEVSVVFKCGVGSDKDESIRPLASSLGLERKCLAGTRPRVVPGFIHWLSDGLLCALWNEMK